MTRRPMAAPPKRPNGGPPPARDSGPPTPPTPRGTMTSGGMRPADPQAEAMLAVAAAIHDLADAVRNLKIVTEINANLTLPGDE